MSRARLSGVDSIQEYYAVHEHYKHPEVNGRPMPQVEHRRPVQLSDIVDSQHLEREEKEEESLGCFSFLTIFARSKGKSSGGSADTRAQIQHRAKSRHKVQKPSDEDLKERQAVADLLPFPAAIEPQRPKPAHTRPHLSVEMATAQSPRLARKVVSNYKKTEGEVVKHAVKVSQISPHHSSVHLAHTSSNNYRVKSRYHPRMTTFGDFIDGPRKTSHALPPLPSSITAPVHPSSNIRSLHQGDHEVQWTISGWVSPSAIPASNHPETFIEDRNSKAEPQQCSICGIPNSPCTRYGDQGLWLCTACRNPSAPVEFPPRIDSRVVAKPRDRSISSSSKAAIAQADNANETCPYCHTSLPSVERNSQVFCSWCCRQLTNATSNPARLTLLRGRSRGAVKSVATEDAEAQWEDFDSHDLSWDSTPSATDSHYYGRRATGNIRPTPPLKDSVYLSKTPSLAKLRNVYYTPPPPSSPSPPPIPQKAKNRKTSQLSVDLPDRASFYPDTPALTPQVTEFPPLPQLPPKTRNRTGRPSSAMPLSPVFAASAKDFPYPPPPIPEERVRRPRRSSSIYPDDDPAPRIHTPDWQQWRKHRRNTSFYDYWETILS